MRQDHARCLLASRCLPKAGAVPGSRRPEPNPPRRCGIDSGRASQTGPEAHSAF
jgi:hypothetical protein